MSNTATSSLHIKNIVKTATLQDEMGLVSHSHVLVDNFCQLWNPWKAKKKMLAIQLKFANKIAEI